MPERPVDRHQEVQDRRREERVPVRGVEERQPAQDVGIPARQLVKLVHEIDEQRPEEETGGNRITAVQEPLRKEVVREQYDHEGAEGQLQPVTHRESQEKGLLLLSQHCLPLARGSAESPFSLRALTMASRTRAIWKGL